MSDFHKSIKNSRKKVFARDRFGTWHRVDAGIITGGGTILYVRSVEGQWFISKVWKETTI